MSSAFHQFTRILFSALQNALSVNNRYDVSKVPSLGKVFLIEPCKNSFEGVVLMKKIDEGLANGSIKNENNESAILL